MERQVHLADKIHEQGNIFRRHVFRDELCCFFCFCLSFSLFFLSLLDALLIVNELSVWLVER